MKGVEALGTLSSDLQGSFRIRDPLRRVSVMALGEVKSSREPPKGSNSRSWGHPPR